MAYDLVALDVLQGELAVWPTDEDCEECDEGGVLLHRHALHRLRHAPSHGLGHGLQGLHESHEQEVLLLPPWADEGPPDRHGVGGEPQVRVCGGARPVGRWQCRCGHHVPVSAESWLQEMV